MTKRIPKSIQSILEQAQVHLAEVQERKRLEDETEQKQKAEALVKAWQEHWAECGPQLPKEIRRYVRPGEDKYDRYYECAWDESVIHIAVPGLAPFIAIYQKQGQGDQRHWQLITYWLPQPYAYLDDDLEFHTSWDWSSPAAQFKADLDHSLEAAILKAKLLQEELEAKRVALVDERQRKQDRRAKAERQQNDEQRVEFLLFKEVQRDPVAMSLLKALVLIIDERSSFVARLQEADYAAEEIESRLGRKLEQARKDVQEKSRLAEDERRRAEDLDLDLGKAKKQLKG